MFVRARLCTVHLRVDSKDTFISLVDSHPPMMSNKQQRQQAESGLAAYLSWDGNNSMQGHFTPGNSLVKDLAMPEIATAERPSEGPSKL